MKVSELIAILSKYDGDTLVVGSVVADMGFINRPAIIDNVRETKIAYHSDLHEEEHYDEMCFETYDEDVPDYIDKSKLKDVVMITNCAW